MSIFAAENKLITGSTVQAFLINESFFAPTEPPSLTNNQIEDIVRASSYYYATNNFVFKVIPEGDETELSYWFFTEGGICPIKSWVMWKIKNDDVPFERSNYITFRNSFDNVLSMVSISSERARMELDFSEATITEISSIFRIRGIDQPEFGILLVAIPFSRPSPDPDRTSKFWEILGFKYTHNPIFSTPPLVSPSPPARVENKYTSKPITFENLFVPKLTGSFVYNFFDIKEKDFDVSNSRNYGRRPLTEIPKYIHLSWTKAPMSLAPVMASITTTAETSDERSDDGEIRTTPVRARITTRAEDSSRSSTIEEARRGSMHIGGIFFSTEGMGSRFAGFLSSDTSDSSRDADMIFGTGGSLGPVGSSPFEGTFEEELLSDDEMLFTDVEREVFEDAVAAYSDVSEYIGYIILKERLDPIEEIFEPVDLIVIPRRDTTNWIDWKIAYGETYRYKIRSVYKFINRDSSRTIYADSDALIDRSGSAAVFDSGILFNNAYYFDSVYSEPFLIDAIDTTPPDPPYDLQVYPNSRKKYVFLTWNQKQQNKDIAGFNIYRKLANDKDKFKRLNGLLIEPRNNFFIDFSIKEDIDYVYAVETIDIHANRSNLSVQKIASIKSLPIEQIERCENPIKIWAPIGLTINQLRPQKEKEILQFNKKLSILINPLFTNLEENTTYLIKIMSLDIFKEKEIKLNFKTKIINHITNIPRVEVSDISEDERIRRARDEAIIPFPLRETLRR